MTTELSRLRVRVTRKFEIARNVHFFELSSVDGRALPACEPGAHVTVATPSGDNRWYSVCSVANEGQSYCIAVKRDADGRGGSISMADHVEVGEELQISEPGNEFRLVSAPGYLLIAGGIGITPVYSMWRELQQRDPSCVQLIYLARNPEETLFLDELLKSDNAHNVTIYHSETEGERYDFWDLLEKPDARHIYCCGSKSLMSDIRDMSGHWPSSQIHFEDFAPVEAVKADDSEFEVHLLRSNTSFEVGASETLLHALRKNGCRVLSSCESGTCGSCKTPYLEGSVDHRDLVLDEKERQTHMMVCVSRSSGPKLTLDL